MLLDLLKRARSYRRFDASVPVPQQLLEEWVECCRYCPSGRNVQALKYALVTERENCRKLFPLLAWAGYLKDWDGPDENERPTAYMVQLLDTEIAGNCLCDDGLQLQALVLAATEAGYGGCIVKSFKNAELRTLLQLPGHLKITYVLALGKPKETVRIEDMQAGDVKYWRTPDGVHHVPKRSVQELIYQTL
ncbi:MAG: nitroreductase family protein [Bacteroides sp.]|nr:nitroreductase family protein [Bacteroides sp.]